MQHKRIRKEPKRNNNTQTIRKIRYQSDLFLDKPLVKTVTKTVAVSVAVFGFLYVSRYFLTATANMITSCKKVRDAWKS